MDVQVVPLYRWKYIVILILGHVLYREIVLMIIISLLIQQYSEIYLNISYYDWLIVVIITYLWCCVLYRFGSFEIFKTQDPVTMRTGPSVGLDELLYKLVDYTIQSYYPKVLSYTYPIDIRLSYDCLWY